MLLPSVRRLSTKAGWSVAERGAERDHLRRLAVDPVGDAVDRLVALGERLLVDDLAAELLEAEREGLADVLEVDEQLVGDDVGQAFTLRFQQLGGKIVDQESFTQGDKTIDSVANRINGKPAKMIAFCTSFGTDQPAFVDLIGNNTPIMNSWAGDGTYWWSKNPKITNYYFVTYGFFDHQ